MAFSRHPEVSEAIRAVVLEWGDHPYDINDGNCYDFAEEVCYRVPGAEPIWGDALSELFDDNYDPVSHAFIRYEGWYFDAEEPDGVPRPTLLPFFQRQLHADEIDVPRSGIVKSVR